MNQSNNSKQVLLSVIGVAILVVAVVGVSFAFFNYTRTGGENTVRTGQINFTSSYEKVNLQNIFPIAKTAIDRDSTNTAEVTVTVQGNTTYANGLDYTITAEDVHVTAGSVSVPLGVHVTPTGLGDTTTTTGNIHRVSVRNYEDGAVLGNGNILATGHIQGGESATAVNGNIKIKVYVDASKVFITDTLGDGVSEANNGNINVTGYINGTTAPAGTTVLTTAQWNALNTNGMSFRVKVVANETPAA